MRGGVREAVAGVTALAAQIAEARTLAPDASRLWRSHRPTGRPV